MVLDRNNKQCVHRAIANCRNAKDMLKETFKWTSICKSPPGTVSHVDQFPLPTRGSVDSSSEIANRRSVQLGGGRRVKQAFEIDSPNERSRCRSSKCWFKLTSPFTFANLAGTAWYIPLPHIFHISLSNSDERVSAQKIEKASNASMIVFIRHRGAGLPCFSAVLAASASAPLMAPFDTLETHQRHIGHRPFPRFGMHFFLLLQHPVQTHQQIRRAATTLAVHHPDRVHDGSGCYSIRAAGGNPCHVSPMAMAVT